MYDMNNTVSQTEAANMLSCLLPRVKRMLKKGVLDLVNVPGARYRRIPTIQIVKLLRGELQTITLRSNTIKNALTNMQTRLDAGEIVGVTTELIPKYDVYKMSYLSDPQNAELVQKI